MACSKRLKCYRCKKRKEWDDVMSIRYKIDDLYKIVHCCKRCMIELIYNDCKEEVKK